jgi:hypothetical protein
VMRDGKTVGLGVLCAGVVMLAAFAVQGQAQDESAAAVPEAAVVWSPNPSLLLVRPIRQQSPAQQFADEEACFDQACADTDWNPYHAYDELVAAGYAVALTPDERTYGLICLAAEGAMVGDVAADLLRGPRYEGPEYGGDRGAEIGAAVAVASAVIHSDYLRQMDDPDARRIINRFERDLKHWNRKFAACLRSRGYRVTTAGG